MKKPHTDVITTYKVWCSVCGTIGTTFGNEAQAGSAAAEHRQAHERGELPDAR